MTTQAIREDVEAQISHSVGLVRTTFDLERYPRPTDGQEFDRRFGELQEHFAALARLFQDYLMASWAPEISSRLDQS